MRLGIEDYSYAQMIEDFRLGLLWNITIPLAFHAQRSPEVRQSIGDDLPVEKLNCAAIDHWDCLSLEV